MFSRRPSAAAASLAAVLAVSLLSVWSGGFASAASPAASHRSITLSDGVQSQPNFWLPVTPSQYCSNSNEAFTNSAYRPLLWISGNDRIDWTSSIASGITVTNDDKTFTVHLKPSWRWSNGSPVTAQDALFGAQVILEASQNNAPWTYCGDGIGGLPQDWAKVTAPNSRTLVITTDTPSNPVWFEHNGIAQIVPMPVAQFDRYPKDAARELRWLLAMGASPTAPAFRVIDGPYGYGPFSNDRYATLVANPHYTGPVKPEITRITFLYETSTENEWAATVRGIFPTANIPSSFYAERNSLAHQGYRVQTTPYPFCYNYLLDNLWPSNPVSRIFKLLYVRQAIQLGINQPGIIALAHGMGYTEAGPVPKYPANPYYDSTLKAVAFNPQAGKRLLMAHDWREVGGVMTKGAQRLSFNFLYMSGSNWVDNTVQLLKADWAQEGIQVTLTSEPVNQVLSVAGGGPDASKWQMVWWGPGSWCYEPDYFPSGGGLFKPGAASNTNGFADGALTALINKTYQPMSRAATIRAMWAYEAEAAKLLPVQYLPVTTGLQVTADWLHGVNAAFNAVQDFEEYNHWRVSG